MLYAYEFILRKRTLILQKFGEMIIDTPKFFKKDFKTLL